jgi:hypothetical protein
MNREEFVGYVESRAEELRIQVHGEGELRGLPCEFQHALALVWLLDALRRPAPSSEALRSWYGHAALASPEAARWVYRVVGSLHNADLERLDAYELMAFCSRIEPWCAFASGLINDRSRNRALINPPKDASAR